MGGGEREGEGEVVSGTISINRGGPSHLHTVTSINCVFVVARVRGAVIFAVTGLHMHAYQTLTSPPLFCTARKNSGHICFEAKFAMKRRLIQRARAAE